jgi:sialate O-acetylesterase
MKMSAITFPERKHDMSHSIQAGARQARSARLHRAQGLRNCFLLAILVLAAMVLPARAEVKLPALIGDNMVLQEGKRVAIWGTAEPGEQVRVTLGEEKATAAADGEGRWKVELGPLKAGGPFEMTVTGKNSITLHNVAVGEVWICSGQSNMEMAVGNSPRAWGGVLNAAEEIAAGNYPMIRQFTVRKAVAGQPQRDAEGEWKVANPETVGEFSAVAYFFGRDLYKALNVPVGLIDSSWGGTPAEAWTSAPALAADPELKTILDEWKEKTAEYPKLLEQFQRELKGWEQSSEKAEAEGRPAPPPPQMPADPRSNSWRAAGLYNGMIAPLLPYTMAGAIWYQGESNADRAYQYRKLFPAMIRNWRRAWGEVDFPFLFVQLAGFRQPWAPRTAWAELREAQTMALALPKTGMAVTVDIGEPYDIHPKNKQEVGRRLALAAEAIAYGRKVVYSGPMYDSMSVEGAGVRLRFTHAGGGLVAKGESLKGFEIAGEDRRFVAAEARISGETVVVRSSKVPHPVAVRYGWDDYPECNLYNKAGLPASPFRTDDWPGVTMKPAK